MHAQGPGCYGHNGADDAAADAAVIAMRRPGDAGPGALAARGGIRLRAGQPGDGDDGARRARRRRAPGRLDHRDLERPAQQPPGQRRQSARRRGAARPAAGAAGHRIVGPAGRRHPQRRAALRFRGEADRPSPDPRDAGADLVAARARRDARTCSRSNPSSTNWPSEAGEDPVAYRLSILRRPARPRRHRAGRAHERLAARHCRRGARAAAAASALRATRTSPPMPLSLPRSRSTRASG